MPTPDRSDAVAPARTIGLSEVDRLAPPRLIPRGPVQAGPVPGRPVVWAIFQPNAPGSGELRGAAAVAVRQQLKAHHQYVAERTLVAVGHDEVGVWATLGGRVVCRCVGRWPRDDVLALPMAAIGRSEPGWPAFTLVDVRSCRFIAELRAVTIDAASVAVAQALEVDG